MAKVFKAWLKLFWLLIILVSSLPLELIAQHSDTNSQRKAWEDKLAPSLQISPSNNNPSTYRIKVKDEGAFKAWLEQNHIQLGAAKVAGYQGVFIVPNLKAEQIKQLASSSFIAYIDRGNRIAKEETELKDADFVANNIPVVHGLFPDLKGNSLAVSVKEGAFDPNDIDLRARVIAPETFGPNTTIHATTMATIIAGAGNSGPNGKGIATRALIAYSDFKELFPDNSAKLLAKGIGVQNHSYGVGVENYYGLESVAYDQQAHQNPQLLHVFSSGNSGNKAAITGDYAGLTGFANLTGQFKTSKNTLSVGAIEADKRVGTKSSRGPAYDGRIKPELVAYGKGGTSESAAVVSGVALLVQQAYKQIQNGVLPPASLLKAALINSADDVGRPAVDFESGFGNTDALGAVKSIQDKRFMLGQVAQGKEAVYTIQAPTGSNQLKVTIVWHDSEALPNSARALVNDLDLLVRNKATGRIWHPWVLSSYPHPDSLQLPARRGVDRINNVEQITISLPEAGTYELVVTGFKVVGQDQEFSLVYEYENERTWLYPTINTALNAGTTSHLKWQGDFKNETARLEFKSTPEAGWQFIKEVNLQQHDIFWQTPNIGALSQLRLINDNVEIVSEPFLIAKQPKVQVGFNCSEQAMIFWSSIKNAEGYQIYRLGQAFLEPLFTTPDTLAILNKKPFPDGLGDFLTVIPIIKGQLALQSDALAYERQGIGCYIKSFLPEQFVMDSVKLDLEVGTTFNLASISLERVKSNNSSTVITTIDPTTAVKYKMYDPSPLPGRNFYRVKLQTQAGNVFYSDTEEVIFAKQGFVQVYPNPVEAGQPLSIAISDDSTTLFLYDSVGKLVYSSEEVGVIKTLNTTGLKKGVYILKVSTATGYVTSRIVVL
jgi:hypothetical protein